MVEVPNTVRSGYPLNRVAHKDCEQTAGGGDLACIVRSPVLASAKVNSCQYSKVDEENCSNNIIALKIFTTDSTFHTHS